MVYYSTTNICIILLIFNKIFNSRVTVGTVARLLRHFACEFHRACPVHPVGFMDLSYGVKLEVRKHFIREGAISTGK
jgi:hypothetical protein